MPDKYSATWVSHSSISDFLNCPRAYYLNNIYRDESSGNKIQLVSPALSLGAAVHEVVEALSVLPTKERFNDSLIERFDELWKKKYSGKRGGFTDDDTEQRYKKQGEEMLRKLMKNPGPLENLAVKIQEDLPHYWLSEEDNIILCGKVDWLEYLPDQDAVHVIDFKTSKSEESESSMQLPIYHLLVHNTQKHDVVKASYWYLRLHEEPKERELPDLEDAHQEIMQVAKRIKTARSVGVFKCPQGTAGCYHCSSLEKIVAGKGEHVGVSGYGQDMFILPRESGEESKESVIL